MKKETIAITPKVRYGRPRVKVDFAVLLRLREGGHLGWTRVAREYQKITGKFVSRETLERRYKIHKDLQSAGISAINTNSPPPKKTDGVRFVFEEIIITRMPDSMKKLEKPTQSENV